MKFNLGYPKKSNEEILMEYLLEVIPDKKLNIYDNILNSHVLKYYKEVVDKNKFLNLLGTEIKKTKNENLYKYYVLFEILNEYNNYKIIEHEILSPTIINEIFSKYKDISPYF